MTGGWDRTSPFCICGAPNVPFDPEGDCSQGCDEEESLRTNEEMEKDIAAYRTWVKQRHKKEGSP